jgi:murein L,D-transpeptidase YafK
MTFSQDFKKQQNKFQRVRNAYTEKEKTLKDSLKVHNFDSFNNELIIVAYKQEAKLEAWLKDNKSKTFRLFRVYEICSSSGTLGPKRKQGDGQVPEGFYLINNFNPVSNFHLSLGINYPNRSDRILSDKKKPGNAIYIHGNCVTIGCLPITDDKIEELYILAVEAKNSGQDEIPVYIFPTHLDDKSFDAFSKENSEIPELVSFWKNLKTGYDIFSKQHIPLKFSVNSKGLYVF